MKKRLFFVSLCILCINFRGYTQDLTINQTNLGYYYDPSTGIISDLYFSVLNTDYVDISWSFSVSVIISNATNPNIMYEADKVTIYGLSASSSVPISDWNIDLNNVSGLPAGNYRLGVYVDSDSDISETDETNNYYYISPQGNNLVFNSTGINDIESILSYFGNYPNPVIDITSFKFTLTEKAFTTLTIYDVTGKEITQIINKDLFVGTYTIGFDASTLPNGIYAYSLKVNNEIITKKFIVSK